MSQFDDKEIKQILNNDYSNPAYTDIELINIEIFKTIGNLFKQFPTLCSIKLKAKEFHSLFYLYTVIEHIIPGNNWDITVNKRIKPNDLFKYCTQKLENIHALQIPDLTGQLKSLDEVHIVALQNIKQVNFHKDIQSRFFNQFEHDPFATDIEIFTFTVKNTRGENNINFISDMFNFLGKDLLTKINFHYLEKDLTAKQNKKGNHERKI